MVHPSLEKKPCRRWGQFWMTELLPLWTMSNLLSQWYSIQLGIIGESMRDGQQTPPPPQSRTTSLTLSRNPDLFFFSITQESDSKMIGLLLRICVCKMMLPIQSCFLESRKSVVYDPDDLFSSISPVESLAVLFNHCVIQQWKLESAFIQLRLKQAFRNAVLTACVCLCGSGSEFLGCESF